jgi:hypothetical protein
MVLIIGGYNESSQLKTKVNLVDLNTGEICPFYRLPDGSNVNNGEGIFTNGRTFACGDKQICVSWDGTAWLENDPPNFPLRLHFQAATILESGQWIAIDTFANYPPATAIYDPDSNLFLQGPTIDIPHGTYGFCMVEIEPNKLGFLMTNGEMYHFQLPNGPLEKIRDTNNTYDIYGSCNVVNHLGIKTGIINMHIDIYICIIHSRHWKI